MTLFRLDSSIRLEGSVSREIADTVVTAWLGKHPDDVVTRRDLTADPLPSTAFIDAANGVNTPVELRTPAQLAGLAVAARLADELLAADAAVIAAPLYNYGVPGHLKSWIDLLITDPRFAFGATPLTGRPLTLVVVRGGGYGPGTPREGWDHSTPYLLRIFSDVFGADVTLVEAELTLADVMPQMAELRGLARTNREQAHELAAATGLAHAERALSAA